MNELIFILINWKNNKEKNKIYKTMALTVLNIRQQRTVIPKRWEMIKWFLWLSELSAWRKILSHSAERGHQTESRHLPELSRQRWKSREATVTRIYKTKSHTGQLPRERIPEIWRIQYLTIKPLYEPSTWGQRNTNTRTDHACSQRQSGNFITQDISIKVTTGILFLKEPSFVGHMVFATTTALCHCNTKQSEKIDKSMVMAVFQ